VVHAEMDAVHHHTIGRYASKRARGKIYFLCAVFSRWPCHDREKRSGHARISAWTGSRGSFSASQAPCASHAQHCLRDVHTILLYQSWALRFATGALVRPLDHWRVLAFENAYKNHGRLPLGKAALHAAA